MQHRFASLKHLLALLTLAPLGCDASEGSLDPTFRDATAPDGDATGSPTGTPTTWGPGTIPPPENPFVCPYRMPGAETDPGRGLPYCATADLADDEPADFDYDDATRLVLAVHGRGGNANLYLNRMTDAADNLAGELRGDTFVIAPQFLQAVDLTDNGIGEWQLADAVWWKDNGSWPIAGMSTDGGGQPYSSFHMIDRLIEEAIGQMPNLREIIITGQSAGGQTVQKYAILNHADIPSSIRVRYLPANPFAYTYLTAERPVFVTNDQSNPDGWEFDPPNLANPYAWPDTEICDALSGTQMPGSYDHFDKGMIGLPEHYIGTEYAWTAELMRAAYVSRDVTYLISEADVTHDEQCEEGAVQAQGKHRRDRAYAFHEHAMQEGAAHNLVTAPDTGHGSALFKQECIQRVVFGLADNCDSIEDRDAAVGWAGAITDLESANIDGDPERETALIYEYDGQAHVLIVDDPLHDYALLANVTLDWPATDRPTDIAWGYMHPEWGIELVVGRASEDGLGDGGWVAYNHDGGSWVPVIEGGLGRNVRAVAIGQAVAGGFREVAVAWDADEGERWSVMQFDGMIFQPVDGGTYAGDARPIDIQIANVRGDDDQREILIGTDAESGPRLYVAEVGAPTVELADDWPVGDRLVGFDTGRFDEDGPREIAVARNSYGWRWQVLDDADAGFAPAAEGGHMWIPSVQPTGIALGRMAWGQSTVALGRTGPVAHKLEMHTFDTEGVLGNIRREADGLPSGTRIEALHFADLDDGGEYELLYGRAGDLAAGWRLRSIVAP